MKRKGSEMDEARASWNTVYQTKEGFECQITLRDEDEGVLSERVKKTTASITKAGGMALRRRNYVPDDSGSSNNDSNGEIGNGNGDEVEKPEKTFVDEDNVRRCNLKLKSGKACGSPVSERQGKYGPFWSCPNYKEHAA
ncbi:MAG: hypothetical protein ACYC0V_07550 [Armatimonadota bacterium]